MYHLNQTDRSSLHDLSLGGEWGGQLGFLHSFICMLYGQTGFISSSDKVRDKKNSNVSNLKSSTIYLKTSGQSIAINIIIEFIIHTNVITLACVD